MGAPFAVVAVARIVCVPDPRETERAEFAQVSQSAVAGYGRSDAITAPSTLMSMGRSAAVPFAYLNVALYVPAAGAFTVHSTYAPAALAVLTKPVPE